MIEVFKTNDIGGTVKKINITVCQGASKLNVPTAQHKQGDFANSVLQRFCGKLIESRWQRLNPGMFVCAYSVFVETYDIESEATKEKLGKGYTAASIREQTKVRTVTPDHEQKRYDSIHPDWPGDTGFFANAMRDEVIQQVWSQKRNDARFKQGLQQDPATKANVDEAVVIENFTELGSRFPTFAGAVVKRCKADVYGKFGDIAKGKTSSDFITKVQLYVRNKVVLKYDGKTFVVCGLSEYTDSGASKEWLDIVTQNMMPRGMSPMSLKFIQPKGF